MREICLATIDENAYALAEKYDLGIELDQFCTAMFMDPPEFEKYDAEVKAMLPRAKVFHGPFNELSPCAIDPEIGKISMKRYNQAFDLMYQYGLRKMVLHGGFVPLVYFPEWYTEQSIHFWKEFLEDKPEDFILCLENVMEAEPWYLVKIAEAINDPRLKLCLDVGHANVKCVSDVPITEWIKEFAPFLSHVHLHNNNGVWDYHNGLADGILPMKDIVQMLNELAPEASFTFEIPVNSEQSVLWYLEHFGHTKE